MTLMNRLYGALRSCYRVDVAYRNRGIEVEAPWVTSGFPILATRPGRFSRFDQLRWALKVRKLLWRSANDYKYVHLHGAYITNMLAVPRRIRKKLIVLPVLESGDLPAGAAASPLKRKIYRRVLKHAFLGLALSAGIEHELVSLGLPRERVLRINNPSGTAVGKGSGGERSNNEFTIGFVGKIGPNKNPHLVLDAVAGLHDRGVQARAILVGPFADSQFEQKFRAHAERLGIVSSVTITGFVEDVQAHLLQMDIFLLPSKHEGMPGALAEAMAFGIPAVVTDVGDMGRHVRAAQSGLVVDAASPPIIDALERLTDPLVRRDIGARARSYAAANFLPAAVATAVQAKIKQLEGVEPNHGS
ncbi:glycosyltransferase [Curtobacterium sp. VKM Ac-1376]|uniref:glycosyltransferase n=1 Tax=Curtobacterium sp. VKM Ac-1376 TaxID=123312 RepID=UPI002B2760CB|nr:glycosyltransferase [Curtobacterium sp. VKM Ac-1376]